MNTRELGLAALLLEVASDHFANHGCNDLELPEAWTQEECDKFTLAMQTWNGDPEEHEPGCRITTDWFAMRFLSAKLKEASESDALS